MDSLPPELQCHILRHLRGWDRPYFVSVPVEIALGGRSIFDKSLAFTTNENFSATAEDIGKKLKENLHQTFRASSRFVLYSIGTPRWWWNHLIQISSIVRLHASGGNAWFYASRRRLSYAGLICLLLPRGQEKHA